MEIKDLQYVLNGVTNAKRIYRDKAADAILKNPELISDLIIKTFDTEDPLHIKAAWVLELVCLEDCKHLDKHIDTFLNGMPKLSHESALRPVAKICWLWSEHYFSRLSPEKELSNTAVELIISCNFDWLIGDHKVATQVFAMNSLYLWGQKRKWILEELKSILESRANSGTKGYRTHARKLLKNL